MMNNNFLIGCICATLVALLFVGGISYYSLQTNRLYANLREECIKQGNSVVENFGGNGFHCIRGMK